MGKGVTNTLQKIQKRKHIVAFNEVIHKLNQIQRNNLEFHKIMSHSNIELNNMNRKTLKLEINVSACKNVITQLNTCLDQFKQCCADLEALIKIFETEFFEFIKNSTVEILSGNFFVILKNIIELWKSGI